MEKTDGDNFKKFDLNISSILFESVILFKAKAQNIIRYLCLQAERNKQKVDEERGEDPDVCATLTQPDTTVKPAKVTR